MLIVPKRSWIHLVLTFRGSILPMIWMRIGTTTAFALVVSLLHHWYGTFRTSLTIVPFSLVALALSIFLGFRNSTAYERFWEGRKLWGQLVNTCRSLARQVLVFVGPDVRPRDAAEAAECRALQRELVYRTIAYAHALRLHLREQRALDELAPFVPDPELQRLRAQFNPPIALLQTQALRLQEAWRRGWIHPLHLPLLEQSLVVLTDVQGGCERIAATPIPFLYITLIHRIVAVYCFSLPLGIIDTVGLATPLVVLMVSYAFFGLDAIGDEIENPFGTDPNDLPLSAISRSIELNLRQSLGETDLPAPLQPDDSVLL